MCDLSCSSNLICAALALSSAAFHCHGCFIVFYVFASLTASVCNIFQVCICIANVFYGRKHYNGHTLSLCTCDILYQLLLCQQALSQIYLIQVYTNKPVEGDQCSLGKNCHVISALAIPGQSVYFNQLHRVFVNRPLHVDPWDCRAGGRRDPALHIQVDKSLYPHSCLGGPLQIAL